ncbi:MAG: hypothetical protein VB021_10070 [Oscillospiraceae bacterium]|nr:hypothetical protein [Oscillospiraceae bacterium]
MTDKTESIGETRARAAEAFSPARTKSRLFLIEFISALAVFCVAAGVCAGLLAVAYKQSRAAAALDGAGFACASCADGFKAAGGDMAACAALLGGRADGDTARVWYDADWKVCAEADAVYTLTAKARGDSLRQADIGVCGADGAQIFGLTASVYVAEGGDGGQ